MHQVARVEDGELLRAFVEREDQGAFGVLVERHTRWLFGAALRQLGRHDLAEEAVQVVFILLAQKARDMDGERQLGGWLFTTLRYVVKKMRRGRERRERHERRAGEGLKNEALAGEQAMREMAEVVDGAVGKLPESYRTAVVLRFYQEMAFGEVAGALGTTEAGARKRVERGVSLLRKRLGPGATTANMAVLAVRGAEQTPGGLGQSACQTALAVKAGAAVPVALSTVIQGAVYFMAMAKVKMAVVVIVAALLVIGIPCAVVVYHSGRQVPPSVPVAGEAAAAAGGGDFLRYYTLQPDEAFKLAADVPAEARALLFSTYPPPHSGGLTGPTDSLDVKWDGDAVRVWGFDDRLDLHGTIEAFMHTYPQQLDNRLQLPRNTPMQVYPGLPAAALPAIKGDLVIRGGATVEEYRSSLEKILTRALGQRITLTFRDVEQKAIVLRGQWQFMPLPKNATAKRMNPPMVEIYGPQIDDERKNGGVIATGDREYFAGHLGAWLRQPVVVESETFPPEVTAHINTLEAENDASHDKILILTHLTEQTGLTWTEEVRKVRHLFIEEGK